MIRITPLITPIKISKELFIERTEEVLEQAAKEQAIIEVELGQNGGVYLMTGELFQRFYEEGQDLKNTLQAYLKQEVLREAVDCGRRVRAIVEKCAKESSNESFKATIWNLYKDKEETNKNE